MDYQNLLAMRDFIKGLWDKTPLLGIVLGSGLSYLQDYVTVEAILEYRDIPGHPVCTNKNHRGRYLFGRIGGMPCVVMDGRLHYFEGYSPEECTLPERLLGLLGTKTLLLTNAVGGISFAPGEVMIVEDHIACFVPSPLRGRNEEELGPRFPDMSDVYDPVLAKKIEARAEKEAIPARRGVFMQFPGPQFETRAEIRMAKTLGADAVGMSTAIEALASRHMGIRNVALSLITNYACGMKEGKITDEEVIETAKKSEKTMRRIFEIAIEEIGNDR